VDETYSWESSKDICFIFKVSLDEEHVTVNIKHGEELLDLGERAHHYLLLTLTRQRLSDAMGGMDMETQGWVAQDRMVDMLDMESSHLNIQIFRIRKQINEALKDSTGLPTVIERRIGEMRFGCSDFQIFRGASLEGTLNCGEI
jgi:hypothetical protein